MKTDTKKSHITRSKKQFNFNSRSFRRSKKRMLGHINGYGRRSLLERIFTKRRGFWWKGRHNGVFGPGSHTTWEFKSGNLALLVSLIFMVLLLGYIALDIFVL